MMEPNNWSQYLAEVTAAGVEKEPMAWVQALESATDNVYDGSVYTVLHIESFAKQQKRYEGMFKL
jgi:hypothetical protein